jgi:hypothetical protein
LIDPSGHVEYDFAGAVIPKGLIFKCAAHRKVSLFRDEPAGPDTPVGSDRTNFLGSFLGPVQRSLAEVPGDYYAQVDKKVVKGGTRRKS